MPYIPETLEGRFFRKTIEKSPEEESLYWFRREDGVEFAVIESARHHGADAVVICGDGRPTGNTIAESHFVITDEMRSLADGNYKRWDD
ncbi:hypothetical protein [Citrobacter werkmanii]|uniref:hypothetical protein n=1 Tax=Citrobacter werkmanii TaxID=67827 RepID=UPI0037C63B0A